MNLNSTFNICIYIIILLFIIIVGTILRKRANANMDKVAPFKHGWGEHKSPITKINIVLAKNPLVTEILKSRKVKLLNGEIIPLRANVNTPEGNLVYSLVKNYKLKKCMEIGFAMGISTLHICQALSELDPAAKTAHLYSIDPFQDTRWKCAGVSNIKQAKYEKYHTWIKDKSYNAMPKFIQDDNNKPIHKIGTKDNLFDFIFIDGWHTFDYTLVDMFYADLITRVGGFILIDDVLHRGPAKAIAYVDTNYSHWKKVIGGVPKTQALYRKVADNTNAWDFHKNF